MTNICERYDDFISNLFIFYADLCPKRMGRLSPFMPTFSSKGWELFGLLPLTYYWE